MLSVSENDVKNAMNLDSSEEFKGILKISSVTPEDSGTYGCTADNGISIINSNFTITIRGRKVYVLCCDTYSIFFIYFYEMFSLK